MVVLCLQLPFKMIVFLWFSCSDNFIKMHATKDELVDDSSNENLKFPCMEEEIDGGEGSSQMTNQNHSEMNQF